MICEICKIDKFVHKDKKRNKYLCVKHKKQLDKFGKIMDLLPNKQRICEVSNCGLKASRYRKGNYQYLCPKHKYDMKLYGYIKERIDKEEKRCCICNSNKTRILKFKDNKLYCNRHLLQMKTKGHIIKTGYDLNDIIVYETYADIIIRNKKGIEINRTKIDLDDLERVKYLRWSMDNNTGYAYSSKLHCYMSRYLMNYFNKDMMIDHINGDKLDNRKNNLRIVTRSQNGMNSLININNIVGYRGIRYNKIYKNWQIYLTKLDGKRLYLGRQKLLEDAIKIRQEAESKYYKDFPLRYIEAKNNAR